MTPKVFPPARQRIKQIWHYTAANWGDDQADAYLRGLDDAITTLEHRRHLWRTLPGTLFPGVYFVRYRRHFIFFRVLPSGALGIISVLHQQMNIPDWLREDLRDQNELD